MEYDKTTTAAPMPAVPSAPGAPHSTKDARAHLRAESGPDADVSSLAQPLRFEFSGKTAMNRFLKAPMTERLCRWNDEEKGEDVVCFRIFVFRHLVVRFDVLLTTCYLRQIF